MKKIIYLLFLVLMCNLAFAHVPTFINVRVTNSSIRAWNEEMDSNTSWNPNEVFSKTYEWRMDCEEDCDNDYDCSDIETDLEDLKDKITSLNKSEPSGYAEKYYNLYLGCFANYTECKNYKGTNEECCNKYSSCEQSSNELLQRNYAWETQYTLLNQTKNDVTIERDNYKGQRLMWAIIGGLIGGALILFFWKIRPEIGRTGKVATSKETSPLGGDLEFDPRRVKVIPTKKTPNKENSPTSELDELFPQSKSGVPSMRR